jgi:L-ribulose-5-phosphate 4-epimerase
MSIKNSLKKKLLTANRKIIINGLSVANFGNVSSVYKNFCLIKPSGVDLKKVNHNDMSVVRLNDLKLLSGKKPSVDTPTHAILYKYYPEIKAIVHTHSLYASSWAQSLKSIPCYGTTHADFFSSEILVTNVLNKEQIKKNYETQIGISIVNKLKSRSLCPLQMPGILVAQHGVFSWGKTIEEAVNNSEVIEFIAKLAFNSIVINKKIKKISEPLHLKHFRRKNGPDAYYGQ